eukprot:9097226-Alexandrium_andersonii.AAC.1
MWSVPDLDAAQFDAQAISEVLKHLIAAGAFPDRGCAHHMPHSVTSTSAEWGVLRAQGVVACCECAEHVACGSWELTHAGMSELVTSWELSEPVP